MYASNISKFVLYMQGTEDHYYVDVKDEIVRGSMVLNEGKLSWPPNPPIPTAVPQYNNGQNGKLSSDRKE